MEEETISINWKEAYEKKLHYAVSLERARTDLMSVNQELRMKIHSLEYGQEELLTRNYKLRSLLEHLVNRGRMHVDDKALIREGLKT